MELKLIEHIKNKEFGLKDFNKSLNKYENYKKTEVTAFFSEYKEDIKNHIKGLFADVLRELEYKFKEFNYLEIFEKPLNKTMINQLMTYINEVTHSKNQDFINESGNLNNNEIKNFSVILYLKNYKTINLIMKTILTNYLNDYDKKTILKKI